MLKHYLILSVYIAMCVILGLIITKVSPKLCFFSLCVKKSQLILSNMAQEQTPCENFYNFTCGKYESFREVSLESSVREDMKARQLQSLVEFIREPEYKDDHRVLKVLKLAFKSCLDLEKIENEGITPLLYNIDAAGGFPLAEGDRWETKRKETSGKEWSIDDAEYDIRYVGFKGGHLFQSYIVNEHEQDVFIQVTPPQHLEFDSSNYNHYFQYVKKIVSLLTKNSSVDKSEIKSMLEFKKELSSFQFKVENCSSLNNFVYVKLQEFNAKHNFFNLTHFLEDMSYTVDAVPEYIEMSHITPTYFDQLQNLVSKSNIRAIANYLMIANIMEVTPMLPKAFRDAYDDLMTNVKGPGYQPEESRDIECVKSLLDKVSSALSALYLKKVFKVYNKPDYLQELVALIKKHLYILVGQLSWMDSETKEKALSKVIMMDYDVPVLMETFNVLTDDTLFRIYYEDLCFPENTSDTLSAFLALQRFESDKNWELSERNFSVFDGKINIFTADVKYDYKRNSVIIPMAFLMYPTFDRRWPNYLNYGGLGTKVAMELSRGIDYSGSNFIKGNRTNWWSVETKANYRQYPNCFISQYNEYLKRFNVNNLLRDPTCVEDSIAVLAGLEAAYNAYLEYDSLRFFPERGLPKLKHFSPKEMFFLDFATFHCSSRTKSFHNQMTEEELSRLSFEYKVNGGLRNFKPFSMAFNCNPNSAMNPSGKCDIWFKDKY